MLLEARMPLPSRTGCFPFSYLWAWVPGPVVSARGNILSVSQCPEVQVCAQFCVLAVGITRERVESEAHTHCLVRKQDFLSGCGQNIQ